MTDIRKPRRGSLAFRPRKRADSLLYRFDYWRGDREILGFIGYKVGMVSLSYKINIDRVTNTEVSGGTVIEVPPMVVYGIRYYLKGGTVKDIIVNDAKILEKLGIKKVKGSGDNPQESEIEEVRLLVYSDPTLTGGVEINHTLRAEIGIGGKSIKDKISIAKKYLGKTVKFSEVFKVGDMVDVGAVSKGKGWQGEIKRFGVAKQRRKATGKVRHVGTLGPWHPHYVMYYVPRAGQMGYHNRAELNKTILLIGSGKIDLKFDHYGFTKSDYVILKGSIPGTVKRPVSIRLAVRPSSHAELKDIKVVL